MVHIQMLLLGASTGKITYKVIEGTGIAEVNTDTGEVTFKKLGTVGIQATKAGDDKYNEITATYRITAIKKGRQDLSLIPVFHQICITEKIIINI